MDKGTRRREATESGQTGPGRYDKQKDKFVCVRERQTERKR